VRDGHARRTGHAISGLTPVIDRLGFPGKCRDSWSGAGGEAFGFEQCLNLGRKGATPRRLETCLDFEREAFEQGLRRP
jgi:hypothetical protein